MIQALFYKKDGKILLYRVKGHAKYADIGQDIVCAGVSSLYLTITNRLLTLQSVMAVDCETVLIGDSDIEQVLAHVLYDGICEIAAQYPENVRVVVEND